MTKEDMKVVLAPLNYDQYKMKENFICLKLYIQ